MTEDQIQEFVRRWDEADDTYASVGPTPVELRIERKIGVVFDLLLELARQQ